MVGQPATGVAVSVQDDNGAVSAPGNRLSIFLISVSWLLQVTTLPTRKVFSPDASVRVPRSPTPS
ncbi:MAG TPA: hypothetical protein VFV41_08945 [Streptosporangiaceae bacterium]|nr:hypothetical protein [Streptosporangiaceae bacterium]